MITSDAVTGYLRESRRAADAVLAEMEAHGERDGIPIVVPETGAFLEALTAAAGARRVVEVGTAIGVSTLRIARALPEDGLIVSFEVDEGRHQAARAYLDRAGVAARTDLRLRDAGEGLGDLEPGAWDMVFLDGLKGDYPRHLELSLPLLRAGGTILVDNTLLGGRVAGGAGPDHWSDDAIETMRRFNAGLLERDDVTAALLPVGDGVLMAVKR
jgi:caffeoyl-CoA O-methyltransferase